MRCAGCQRELKIGDRYIEDSVSGFAKTEIDPEIEGLMGDILSVSKLGSSDGTLRYCESCTVPGGDYQFETVYGDEEDAPPEEYRHSY